MTQVDALIQDNLPTPLFVCSLLCSPYFGLLPPAMLPTTTTCAKTLQAAQAQEKQAAAEFVHLQKQQMYETVNEAILHYSTSTGKPQDVARQELFTIERLNRRKRILSPRDIFIREKMQEINKGMFSCHLRHAGTYLELIYTR